MKVEINSMDNGSGMNDTLEVWGDYNPQNKVFNKVLCRIEADNFIECFPEHKQNKIVEQMENGKCIFDVSKESLFNNCKQWFV